MAARITAAEARRLGVDVPAARQRTTRQVARGAPYHSRCTRCGEEFRSEAAEERHLVAAHHARYELVIGGPS